MLTSNSTAHLPNPSRAAVIIAVLLVLSISFGLMAIHAQDDQRPYIGIQTSITSRGTEVVAVVAGSPGDAAGFQVGDLILSANGITVLGDTTLESIISKLKPGTVVRFVVLRQGKAVELSVTLGVRPPDYGSPVPQSPTIPVPNTPAPTVSGPKPFMGIELVNSADGVRVTKIVPGGPADTAQVKVDDILVAIDNQPVGTTEQSQAILNTKHPGDTITLTLRRGTNVINVQLNLIERPSPVPTAGASGSQPTAVSGVPCTPDAARVQLGVTYEVVTDKLVVEHDLKVNYGALVTGVTPKSPADVGGIKVDDVIIEVEGDKVDAKRTLAIRLIPYSVGDTITLTVMRGADKLSIPVTFVSGGAA